MATPAETRMLSEKEMTFCRLYARDKVYGVSNILLYRKAFPEESKGITETAIHERVRRLLKDELIKQTIEDITEEAYQQAVGDKRTVIKMMYERSINPYDRLRGLPMMEIERRNVKTGEVLGYDNVPVVNGPYEVPDEMKPFISQYMFHADLGVFEVIPRDTETEKTRAKYTELLGKAGGVFTERVEISGKDGGAIETITAEMDPVKAAEIYRNATKGNS